MSSVEINFPGSREPKILDNETKAGCSNTGMELDKIFLLDQFSDNMKEQKTSPTVDMCDLFRYCISAPSVDS